MNQLNTIQLEGNLVKDPQRKETPKGTPVCTFSVASNRYYRQDEENKQEVSFFDVETWSDTAETCAKVLKKGRGVRILGRLKQDRWEDADGKNQYRIKIVADRVEFQTQFNKNGKGKDGESDIAAEGDGQPATAEVF
ncbi:single-stranded DNA-binding protein [Marispirochaeta sp.]|uniref:single-stranded DNA-binding protein n=1 Tax=Marispirochaeta sp. TaxID=2038653 RepID=UPI0029C7F92D|nr:single-stranded DNA-binding protein [Marispirochaeta sp.]